MQKYHKTVALACCIFQACVCLSIAGELRFYSENIEVTLYPPDTVAVSGTYFFTASDTAPCKQRIIYPFPGDTGAAAPVMISVNDNGTFREIPFNRIRNGISFGIDVPAKDTAAITVRYRQRFANNTGRYILTTTANWGRPLSNSTYVLRVPTTINLDYLSYACDTVYTSAPYRIYSFFKKDIHARPGSCIHVESNLPPEAVAI